MSASCTPPDARRSSARRLADAVRRRVRYAWSRLTLQQRRPAEAALEWLLAVDTGQGIPSNSAVSIGCPGVTGACIETALSYGCREEAKRWARWLISIQRPDGSLPDAELAKPSFGNTAQAARGLLAIVEEMPEVEDASRRACEYLCSWIDDQGRMVSPGESELHSAGHLSSGELPDLASLVKAAQRWSRTDWTSTVARATDYWAMHTDGFSVIASVDAVVRHVETYLELQHRCAAGKLMERVGAVQRPNGSMPERFDSGPVLSSSLARSAVVWYRLGCADRANRAMRYLERRQSRTGGFRDRLGWAVCNPQHLESTWAAKHYLDAAQLRVRAAFERERPDLPGRIDPADGRMRCLFDWFATLPSDARVADVGCGRGRFLKHLAARFPLARLTGIDISPTMLAHLPQRVTASEGSLLRTGAADGAFDGAFAVEALEHSLVPERAIGELCRIVRPGGRILLIDKHRGKQPLSEHDPWERWFLPEELTRWLARYCDQVNVEPVSHSEGRPGSDLFLGASGIRRDDL